MIDPRQLARHIGHLASLGPRIDGSDADAAAVRYVCEELRSAGAQVKTFGVAVPVIEGLTTLLSIIEGDQEDVACLPNLRPGLTTQRGISADLVLVNKGFDSDFAACDCEGKIALSYADKPFEGPDGFTPRYLHDRTQAADRAGCAGLVMAHRREDNLIATWGLTHGLDTLPSVNIGFQDFLRLRERLSYSRVSAHLVVHGEVRDGTSEIVLGGIPAPTTSSSVIVVVGSHHETVPGSPGANDNATGVATILELARHFARQPLRRHDLLFVATGGEESGHWANAIWVEENASFLKSSVKGVFVALCFGVGRPAVHTRKWNGMTTDGALNAILLQAARDLGQDLRALDSVPFLSEATEYLDHGIPATLIMPDVRDLPYYHTSSDTFHHVEIDRVQAVAELLAQSVRRLDTGDY